jgi:hypothetical protein
MIDNVEERLQQAAQDLRGRDVPAPELAELALRRRARRRHRTAAAVVAASIGLAALLAGLASRTSEPTTVASGPEDPGGSTPSPIPPDGAIGIWVDDASPSVGQLLSVVVVNRSQQGAELGVAAELERWVDDRWVATGRAVTLCLAEWRCDGEIGAGTATVPLVGVTVLPGSVGPLLLLRIDDLQPGRYRLSQQANDGRVAAAVLDLEASSHQPKSAPDDPIGYDLEPTPILVPAHERADVALRAIGEDLGRPPTSLPPGRDLVVETWDGGRWRPVATLEGHLGPNGMELVLPPLAPGPHRIRTSGHAEAFGIVWAVAGL